MLKSVENFVKEIKSGTFGICMVSLTEPKMNKTGNELFGRVRKLTYTANVALGYDYVEYLKAKAKKQGITDFTFDEEKPKGKHWVNFPYILASDKDESKKYLRCYYRPNTKVVSVYYVDDRIATKEEIEYAKGFMPKVKPSAKQMASGLNEENEVVLRDYTLENVICLVQGEKVFDILNPFIGIKEIKEHIKFHNLI